MTLEKLSIIRGVVSHCACLLKSGSRKHRGIVRDACRIAVEIMPAIVPLVLEDAEGQYSVLINVK